MPAYIAIAIVVAIGLVLGLALVAALARSGSVVAQPGGASQALWMSMGMLFGALLGAIVWMSTGEFVFWVIFTGGGMVTGLAMGSSMAHRHR
jgi:hypothetical protein